MSEESELAEVIDAHRAALERASEWREQAGVLRRRALREGVSDEDRQEAHERASWFEGRARILAETMPRAYLPRPIYPRELATPSDRLDAVDELRQALAEVRDLAAYVAASDLEAFVGALVATSREPPAIGREVLEQLEALSRLMADALGAGQEPHTPYETPRDRP